jgi:peptidoglycan/xylan/chitin deacetylase (PgdA/CDA1 family)
MSGLGWKQVLWHRSGIVHTLASRPVRALFERMGRRRATVFMLHDIDVTDNATGADGAAHLRNVIAELRNRGFQLVSLESIVRRFQAGEPQIPDSVAFTMDDGLATQAEAANQVFAPLGCPVTIFLISGFIDGTLWPWDYKIRHIMRSTRKPTLRVRLGSEDQEWSLTNRTERRCAGARIVSHVKELPGEQVDAFVASMAVAADVELPSAPPPNCRPMSWNEARALERRGVQFGAHSVTHSIIARLNADSARYELEESWRRVGAELSSPTPVFAWPTGRYQDFLPRDIACAQALGLLGAVATNDDYASVDTGPDQQAARFALNRFAMPAELTTVLQYSTWLEEGKKKLLRRSPGPGTRAFE